MTERVTGEYVPCTTHAEPFLAFVPLPLPPSPALVFDDNLHDLLEQANRALGRLDGLTALLPDTQLFTYFYIRKEAVLSSQIEGTQTSLEQFLLFEMEEAPGVPLDDVKEVSSYVRALNYGLLSIRSPGQLPILPCDLSTARTLVAQPGPRQLQPICPNCLICSIFPYLNRF
jgi:Fic family protein